MDRIEPADQCGPGEKTSALRRRRTVRLLAPLGVAGVAAATIGLVPALASSADQPDLPAISAKDLVAKLAGSEVETVSGMVKITTDLGLPPLLAAGAPEMDGSPFGPGPKAGGSDSGSGRGGGEADPGASANPRGKLIKLLSGTHTVRMAADGPDRQKISLVEDTAEYSVIRNGDELWAYDSGSNEAYHAEVPRSAKDSGRGRGEGGEHKLPEGFPATPKEAADKALKAVGPTTSVTVDGTSKIAGQDAYNLKIAPKQAGSTIGSVTIAVDADNGAPLKFTLAPAGGGDPVVDIGFTDVSFDKPSAKTFEFTPPKGTSVTEGEIGEGRGDAQREKALPDGLDEIAPGLPGGLGAKDLGSGDVKVIGEGWTSVVSAKSPGGPLGGGDGSEDARKGPAGGFDPRSLLKSFGEEVSGDFGGGTVITSRLVNVLITDDGEVYAGAVTKSALVKAAEGE